MSDLDDILRVRGSLGEALRTGIILLGLGSAVIVGIPLLLLILIAFVY